MHSIGVSNKSISRATRKFALSLPLLVTLQGTAHAAVGDIVRLDESVPTQLVKECSDEFLKHAPAGWSDLKSQAMGIQVPVEYVDDYITRTGRHGSRMRWEFHLASDGQGKLVKSDNGNEIESVNSRYFFRVERDAADTPFHLDRCSTSNGQTIAVGKSINQCDTIVGSMWSVWWVPFDYITTTTGFELIAAQYDDQSPKHVHVAFRYGGMKRADPYYCEPEAVYWAELVPNDNWAVVRSGVVGIRDSSGERLAVRATTKLQESYKKAPFPETVILEYSELKSNEIVEVREIQLGYPEQSSAEPTAYFLPAYGISENTVPSLSPNRARIPLIALGVLGIVLALAGLFVSARRNRVA